jgi:adenylate kinase family enzyme
MVKMDSFERSPTRIVVVGVSGSGKTTFASQLALRLGVAHIELDALHWRPGWQPAPLEVFRQQVLEATSGPAWTIDGNYSKVRNIVWGRAQQVIWLDYSFALIMYRVISRTFWRITTRQKLWSGNRETIKGLISKDNIILWSFQTYFRRKRNYPVLFSLPEYSHLEVIRLKTPKQAREWLERFPAPAKLEETLKGC